jgi:hypothetical protein
MKLNSFIFGSTSFSVLILAGCQTTMPQDYYETLSPVNDADGNNYVSYQAGKGAVQAWQNSPEISSVQEAMESLLPLKMGQRQLCMNGWTHEKFEINERYGFATLTVKCK